SFGMGLGKIAGKVFRIGHLGDTNNNTVIGALAATEMSLALAGIPHKKGGVQAAMDYLVSEAQKPTRNTAEQWRPARAGTRPRAGGRPQQGADSRRAAAGSWVCRAGPSPARFRGRSFGGAAAAAARARAGDRGRHRPACSAFRRGVAPPAMAANRTGCGLSRL